MVCHIVAWNFKEGFSENEVVENAKKAKKKLEHLKSIIPGIMELEANICPSPKSDRQFMLYGLFQTEADLENYQVHPAHESVGIFISSILTDRICLDFNK